MGILFASQAVSKLRPLSDVERWLQLLHIVGHFENNAQHNGVGYQSVKPHCGVLLKIRRHAEQIADIPSQ